MKLENVTFSYDPPHPALSLMERGKGEGDNVLSNVSFEAKPGEIVAFVGETGSGKTTILRLLTRLNDPQKGRILIDGKDIKTVQRKSLVEQMAVVPQESLLFTGTIRENLLIAKEDASEEEMLQALKAAKADFVFDQKIFPQGLDTDIGSRGDRLSGGQKQRIAIARAFLRRANLLILDEPTSDLDNESERLIQEALAKLMRGRTTFVVAHRLTTIQNADKIVVMDKGKIVEMGTHHELLAQGGKYRKLWEAATQIKALP
ncbi:MAG: ATP-binding cassette domain-containing protein [Elusimicrobia bacterium]|nr:ATP-binding cassette domain-containing protein [Elusimicrobiota bacterium]